MQKPLTLKDVFKKRNCPVWFESRNGKLYGGWVLVYELHGDGIIPGERIGLTQPSGHIMWLLTKWYNNRWRCWKTYPTNGEMEDAAWDEKI